MQENYVMADTLIDSASTSTNISTTKVALAPLEAATNRIAIRAIEEAIKATCTYYPESIRGQNMVLEHKGYHVARQELRSYIKAKYSAAVNTSSSASSTIREEKTNGRN